MRKILRFMFAVTLVLTSACTTLTVTKPSGCEGSLIWKASEYTGLTPDVSTALVKLANARFLRAQVYSPEYINVFLVEVDTILGQSGDITYADLVNIVSSHIGWLKANLSDEVSMIAVVFGDYLSQKVPIDSCDLEILRKFIAEQKAVTANYL